MRSFHLMALATAVAVAGTACGDGGNGPTNNAPIAAFTETCPLLSCTFDNTSSDPDNDALTYAWTFGDGGTSPDAEPSHDYATAGTYTVKLTVTDDNSASDDFEKQITVSTTPANQAPVANFTPNCSSLNCTFTNASTDADGTFSSSWNFGDGSALSPETSPAHSYTATSLSTFTVTLTVTDDDGATAVKTLDISVAPPSTLTCGTTPDCSLLIDTPARVTVTLVSSDCQLSGNTFKVMVIPPGGGTPVEEVLFTDGCDQVENPPGTVYPQLQGGAVFTTGTEIKAQVISGGSTLELPPAIRVTGTFGTGWTLEFDDGAQSEPPEPDFNDLVIRIVATP